MSKQQTTLTNIKSVKIIKWHAAITLAFLCSIQASAQSPTSTHDPSRIAGTYSVSQTGRPLAQILLQLQQAFLSPIDYEEVAYENSSILKSTSIVTKQGRKTLLFTPKATFSATLTQEDSTPYLALQSVLAQYKAAGLYAADGYQVIQQAGRIDVLPYQVLAENGSTRKVAPVMGYPVTFPPNERTIEDTLTLLFQQASLASGKRITLLTDPFTSSNAKVSIGANAETPGDILADIGESIGATLSYQCLFDPSDSAYYVNIYPVAASVTGSLYNNKAPGNPQTQPTRSVFFTKDLPK